MSVVKQLAGYLNKNDSEVRRFLLNAPQKYKVYKIPKRTHGHRVIAQPSKELKEYQRAFLDLYSFPVHSSAMAYCKGKSIKDNALAHVKNEYFLKIDLENFFNSIDNDLFWNCFDQCSRSLPNFTFRDRETVEKIIFWTPSKINNKKLILSVGAPSSPLLSNFCFYEFDQYLNEICIKRRIIYTRYADDLTFSTNVKQLLHTLLPLIKDLLIKLFNNALRLNNTKTVFSSRAHNRHVTGVTINNNGELSIGRERKRYIKHLVHQFKCNQLDGSDIGYLQGLLSFAKHIDPAFIGALEIKYTDILMQNIYKANYE